MHQQKLTKKQAEHRRKQLSGRKPGRLILKLAGNTRAAHLLTELVSWWPYTTIQRGGDFWIVRSYDDLETETGLSRNQVKRSLRDLEERGVIRRERHQFAGRKVHLWITFEELVHAALWGDYEIQKWEPELVEGGRSDPAR